MRVAALDCGTNSLRILVADATDEAPVGAGRQRPPALREVTRDMEIVRLGQGVDATGLIAPEALARALVVVRDYARRCDDLRVERVRVVATSASRDAGNAADFVEGVREAFQPRTVEPEVLGGEEEARLSFLGATAAVAAAGNPGPYLVVDLGGGSTEFVRGDIDDGGSTVRIDAATSVDLGSVRLFERHLRDDPPSGAQVGAARAEVAAVLDRVARTFPLDGLGTLVGVAGTVTTLTAHALRLPGYERGRIHLADVPVPTMLDACDDLLARTVAARAALPFMHPGRADVIGAGALAWGEILRRLTALDPGLRVVTCEHDILDGVALELAR